MPLLSTKLQAARGSVPLIFWREIEPRASSRLCSGGSGCSRLGCYQAARGPLPHAPRTMLSFVSLSFTLLIPMGWDVRPLERPTTRTCRSSSRMHSVTGGTARDADAAGSALRWLASNSLKLATRSGNADLVKALIAAGASLEDGGGGELQRPLEYAVSYHGNAEVVKALVEAGASLETAGGDELTPLEYAIDDGNVDVVKVLLEAGASLEAADGDDFTALKYATHVGNVDVIKVLIEGGASPEDAGGDELTPLKFAIHNENVDVIKALIEAGASLEAAGGGSNDFTPLECAIYNGNVEVVKVLVEAGASLEAADGGELTPLKYGAAACSHTVDLRPYSLHPISRILHPYILHLTPHVLRSNSHTHCERGRDQGAPWGGRFARGGWWG